MLQASRSTGNARETMRPPGIKRSTLFRARDTRSSARRLDSRITVRNIEDKRVNESKVVSVNSELQVKLNDCENNGEGRNIAKGHRSHEDGKFKTRINENEAIAEVVNVLENLEPKIHLKSGQVLEADCSESSGFWEWKVDEGPCKSEAMSKLRSLRRERNDVFTELRSSLQNMLAVVRRMKNQHQSRCHYKTYK